MSPVLTPWNDPSLKGAYQGKPLVILGTGPSYDLLPDKENLKHFHIFALNVAITEVWHLHQNVWWVSADYEKIWRHGMRRRIGAYKNWKLITRRILIPTYFGKIPWKDRNQNLQRVPYRPQMGKEDYASCSTIWWHGDIPGEGYMPHVETSAEHALYVAGFWGFSPIAIVGVDLRVIGDCPYSIPWKWKQCHIRPWKFQKMRDSIASRRKEWPARTYSLSPYWAESPFERRETLDSVLAG